MAVKSR